MMAASLPSSLSSSAASLDDQPSVQSAEFPELLSISPSSFKVDVQLHVDHFLDLHLTNLTPHLLTFKIKTTARDRYLLKPTQDYIPPHGSKTCKIVISALSHYPDPSNPKNVKDKFLVQSVQLSSEVPDLGRYWKEREARHSPKEARYAYAEQIVKCRLNVPLPGGGASERPTSPSKGADDREDSHRTPGDEVKETAASRGSVTPGVDHRGGSRPPTSSAINATASQLTFAVHSTPGPGVGGGVAGAAGQRTPGETLTGEGEGRRPADPASDSRDPKLTQYNEVGLAGRHSSHCRPAVPHHTSARGSPCPSTCPLCIQLMDFVVRLTAQMEREKSDAAVLADRYNKALATIASQGKKIALLQQMQAQASHAQPAQPQGAQVPEGGPAAQAGEGKGEGKEEAGSGAAMGMRERLMSGEGVRNNSGGLSWQIYQIILVAIIAFLLGRILSK